MANFQDSFVSDLTILAYELLPAVDSPLHMGDPQKHPIVAIVFEIYN